MIVGSVSRYYTVRHWSILMDLLQTINAPMYQVELPSLTFLKSSFPCMVFVTSCQNSSLRSAIFTLICLSQANALDEALHQGQAPSRWQKPQETAGLIS